jgi:hypothetical protein
MAQASSFNSSIRYQVCKSVVDNDISHISSIKPTQQTFSSITDDDLCEITISPSTIKKTSLSLSSPNHHTSSLTQLLPTTSSGGQTSSSAESATLIKSNEPSSPSEKNPLGSTLSIISHKKQTNIQQLPSNNRQSISRQSIFGTLATTLTAVRKSSTTALALAQQRLSTDNGNLFSGYQGNLKRDNTSILEFSIDSILRD